LNQAQFDALVSLVYNVGGGDFAKSKMLRKLNAGDYQGAPEEFLDWDHAGGERIPGLTIRRRKEHDLFVKGAYR
jgi:lysozyme